MRRLILVIVCCLWLVAIWSVEKDEKQQVPKCSFCREGKCKYHLAADRQLTPDEKKMMENAIHILLDRKRNVYEREEAAWLLGEKIAHRDCIEVLKRVAFDKKEDRGVRYWAATALSQIADRQIIPLLIDLTLDDEVGGRAKEQLWKLTGLRFPPGIKEAEKEEKWEDWWARIKYKYHKAWMDWWEKNKDTFVIDRTKALIEY